MERTILDLFVASYPGEVRSAAIFNALWGLDPNGGPISAANNISVRVNHINKALKSLGWRIGGRSGTNGRRLHKLAVAALARAA